MSIDLPYSKSMLHRLLLMQAVSGQALMPLPDEEMSDDVLTMYTVLRDYPRETHFHLGASGTAMRFLTAYLADSACCHATTPVVLDGCERLRERPLQPLLQALHEAGAKIECLGQADHLPLRITPVPLQHHPLQVSSQQSTQFVSALLLTGHEVTTDTSSPYIFMTRALLRAYENGELIRPERCWSSAAFWYEYTATHGGELLLNGLTLSSIQGDRVVADIYRQWFGIESKETADGVLIRRTSLPAPTTVTIDFAACPDLYPAMALTCERLGHTLVATGTQTLPLKESNRLESVRLHQVNDDHRIAMALLAADYPVADADTQCIRKSYPHFVQSLWAVKGNKEPRQKCDAIQHITPRRGINDDHLGKKHALHKLIGASHADIVWLHDDDVVLPAASDDEAIAAMDGYDMLILPLKMQSRNEQPGLLEQMQMTEYAALQQLTIRSAQRGQALMCSGANLLVYRDVWLEAWPELHPEIASGDDMFLLQAVRRRGLKIGVSTDPRMEATIYTQPSLRAFLRQRMRWAGKSASYTDPFIRRYGAMVTAIMVLQLLCPLVVLLWFPLAWRLAQERMSDASLGVAILLALVYPYYGLVCLLGGLVRTYLLHRHW